MQLGPLCQPQKSYSLGLAQTTYLHGLIRRGDIYEARKMSIAFARAAARSPDIYFPFSRRRLPMKTMSSILQALVGDNSSRNNALANKSPNRPSYSFLYLISQFPTPGARAARMFVSHHAKLGDRRALRDFLMLLIFGLLSAEMIGGAVALYSQWCRKFAISEAQKLQKSTCTQTESTTTTTTTPSTPTHVTWQPSKTLIKMLLDRLHASQSDPYKQIKGDALLHIAHLLDDRIRMPHYASMISALSQYTRAHKSSQYTLRFEHILQNLSDDITSGHIFTNTNQSDYKRVKGVNASSYNALIHHFTHARDVQRVESLLQSFNSRHGTVRSDTLNAILSASVDVDDLPLSTRLVEFLQWKINNQPSHLFETHSDERVLAQLKKMKSYKVDDETISALLKYYVAVGEYSMVAPLTYQHLPHLNLNTPKEERGKVLKQLDEQSSSDLFAALHRNLKTGLSSRLLKDRHLENMAVESLTSLMAIMAQEASKYRKHEMSLGWGGRRWIRTNFHARSREEIANEKQYKKIYKFLKLRCNSATYLAASLYKSVRHRPSKHHVGRCEMSIDEGFLNMCLKTFAKSRYNLAIDDVLLQYHQRGYTPPTRYSDRFDWIKSQDPHLIQSTFNKSRVPLIFPQHML